ncbi:MAG: hypothetical protein CO186_04375 [Zetaproteobacteria bacterium CG_4_9_14_3_um_filter_49_83]|nr:MAG: hypothetical protein AUJ56_04775 [Zetaproteobacteria bacterium CG1_02_49_23]PIQ34816.1 MAG: hypothetical protein COW62_00640 [Zetaproteobacteria bacterium CG17_big_fil_post_rev_8_21_14_2_50_50_13]PIV29485.1 MAG: hypothetical protein COS35_11770 [Zetaproteobacteria bacterium CG02_land_8_20_14_3_00_50_9]PIY55475.1 MAG: hypothetical protein COZ00_09325 [Zetaproteobacteria bacterium CG_4_10_14_0_8_um_filter_49_80]PJA35739.1 MAG: hypothetical protein CO186_04375 [Zetaproteobacteria bacterium
MEQQMAHTEDQLILRNGQTLSGKVLKNEFKIKTSYGEVLIKKEDIAHICFMRADETGFPAMDEIKTYQGDDIKGALVKTHTLSFVLAANNQTARIAKDKIHSITFMQELDTDPEGYPQLEKL